MSRLIAERDLATFIKRCHAHVDEVRDLEVNLRDVRDRKLAVADELGVGFSADIAFEELVASILRVGEAEDISLDDFGADFAKTRRALLLDVPVDEACRNDTLVKSFYVWENWQSNIPVATGVVRNELNATRALLAEAQP